MRTIDYVSVVMVLILGYAVFYWFIRGKRTFRAFDKGHLDEPMPSHLGS